MDLVFYIKGSKTKAMDAIAWPAATRVIPVYEGDSSSLYGALYTRMKDAEGRVLPNFLRTYARGLTPERIAFVGFSAAHGFLNPLLANDLDRQDISAVLLMDATFDGFGAEHGKTGYVKFGIEAAEGDKLMVSTTANTATWDPVNKRATHLTGTDSFRLVWDDVAAATGLSEEYVAPRAPLPEPVKGVHRLGDYLYWYEYVNTDGSSQIGHVQQEGLAAAAMQAYLAPYWAGELTARRSWLKWLGVGALAAAVGALGYRLGRRAPGATRRPALRRRDVGSARRSW